MSKIKYPKAFRMERFFYALKGVNTMPQPRARPNLRPDHNGTQRAQFESNKKKIYATQKNCGICGMPVDFGMKWPHSLSPCIDHIIPVSKGGHASDIGNLQLAFVLIASLRNQNSQLLAEIIKKH